MCLRSTKLNNYCEARKCSVRALHLLRFRARPCMNIGFRSVQNSRDLQAGLVIEQPVWRSFLVAKPVVEPRADNGPIDNRESRFVENDEDRHPTCSFVCRLSKIG